MGEVFQAAGTQSGRILRFTRLLKDQLRDQSALSEGGERRLLMRESELNVREYFTFFHLDLITLIKIFLFCLELSTFQQ